MTSEAGESGRSRPSLTTALLVLLAASTRARIVTLRFFIGADRFDGWGQRTLILAGDSCFVLVFASLPVVEALVFWIVPFSHDFPLVHYLGVKACLALLRRPTPSFPVAEEG